VLTSRPLILKGIRPCRQGTDQRAIS
jgi:hypothetical protein